MANEITITARLSCANLGAAVANATQSFSLTQSGSDVANETGTATTSVVSTAGYMSGMDLTSDYWLFIRNMDATNYITLWSDASGTKPMGKLKAGEPWGPVKVPGNTTVYTKADTASCRFELVACEA